MRFLLVRFWVFVGSLFPKLPYFSVFFVGGLVFRLLRIFANLPKAVFLGTLYF